MVKIDDAFARDELTAVFPSGQRRYEMRRRRELDVDLQPLLQVGDCAQDSIVLGNDRDVDIYRTSTPMFQDHARAASEVDAAGFAGFDGDGAHELAHHRLGYGLTHSDARSKLTNFRISAL